MGAPYRWTQERLDFIAENYKGVPYKEMARMVNEKFGEPYITVNNIKPLYVKMGYKNGNNSKFYKGQETWNKGRKVSDSVREKMAGTMFKKGNRPRNWKPVGSERVSVDGYVEIKVAEPNKWKLKHRVVWEQAYGPIPKDYCVTFKDRNPLNLELDNLMVIKRSQLSIMNKVGLYSEIPELTEVGAQVAELMNKINRRKRK